MENDDEAAKKARAENLMREIERLTSPAATEPQKSDVEDGENKNSAEKVAKEAAQAESPREFIHRRMYEIDHEKKD